MKTNDTSFESPNIEHLDSGKKLGVVSSLTLKVATPSKLQKHKFH